MPCAMEGAQTNRKGTEMKNLTYEAYLANPSEVMEQVEREARSARAEAVHEFIVAPLAKLFERTPVLQPRTA